MRLCRVVVLVSLLRIHPDTKIFEMQTWLHDLLRKTADRLFQLDEVEVNRIFLARANPFALSARRLLEIAGLVHERFPQSRSIGCFTRVIDVAMKSDEEPAELAKRASANSSSASKPAMTKRSRPWVRDMRPPISSNIDINMLTVYKSSELYREIDAGRWIEAGEIEKYEEIRKLTLSLEIPAEFAGNVQFLAHFESSIV